jgi:hypothetical protein
MKNEERRTKNALGSDYPVALARLHPSSFILHPLDHCLLPATPACRTGLVSG